MKDNITMDIRPALKSQYRSALAMLRQTITLCPDDLWLDPAVTNRYWQIAYHALFFTHFYLQRRMEDFKPWVTDNEHFERFSNTQKPPYSRDKMLEYAAFIEAHLDQWIDAMDLDAAESGFGWYKMPKLEHQFVNIRHMQHHVGQLADRLRIQKTIATDWRG